MIDPRMEQGTRWLHSVLSVSFEVKPLAGDASFRRYFRVTSKDTSWVLMDAPPEKEDVSPFLQVRAWLEQAGLRVPHCVALDQPQGFLLLEDFADATWAICRTQKLRLEPLFENALEQLHRLQASQPSCALPDFDVARMQRECDLYLDWYLPKVVNEVPSEAMRERFHQVLLPSLRLLAALPKVPVHLDFHSRNLMLPTDGLPLGIIDFQDAVRGPVTYDLASLLYDCYQDYPESERRKWSYVFFESLPAALRQHFVDFEAWHGVLRLTAFQRHLKAMGIFSRLAHRDGKRQFLDEIPLTRKHIEDELAVLQLPESLTSLLR